MNKRIILGPLLTALLCVGTPGQGNPPEKPLKIRAIYPAGEEVSISDRITIEFNQNIVALGTSMFVDDIVPVDIEPAVECEWNWVKLNTLQCELPIDSNLDASTKYTVTVKSGIQSPSGQMMDAEYIHIFETITPMIRSARLTSWKSPTEPIFDVFFNQSLNLDSLQDRLFLFDSASGREIPTKICPDTWRRSSDLKDDYFGRLKKYQIFDTPDCAKSGLRSSNVLVLAKEPLSSKSDVSLVLLPGLKGATGDLTSTERVLFDTEISTFGDFRFLGLVCQNVHGESVFRAVDQPDDERCRVHGSYSVVFSSRFGVRSISEFVHFQPSKKRTDRGFFLSYARAEEIDGFEYRISGIFRSSTTYRLYIASNKETKDDSESTVPVKDGFGRSLIGSNEITFRTTRPEPKAYLDGTHVVVDSQSNADPLVYVGNVEDVVLTYDLLDEVGFQQQLSQNRQGSSEDDVLQKQFLGLRNFLRSPSGVVSGTIESRPKFEYPEEILEKYFFVQATPYSIFFKLGTVKSLAWVVSLQTGEPIANAEVEFYVGDGKNLDENQESIQKRTTNVDGLVFLPGYETFDPHWNRAQDDISWACRESPDCPTYFLRVQGKEGMALLPLDTNYKIRGPYRVNSIYRNLDHWSTTAQNLYMPGDTVHIKGYVRTSRNEARVIPDHGHFALCVRGPNSREYEITPISLNQFGAYHASLKLHDRAEFGEYRMNLRYDPDDPVTDPCSYRDETSVRYEVTGGSFDVFEFKTNPIAVTQNISAEVFERGDKLTIKTHANLHAGGPYAHALGNVIVYLKPEDPPFASVSKYDYTISRKPNPAYRSTLHDADIELDEEGTHTSVIESLDSSVYYGELRIESSVISDRGKSVATRSTLPYFGVDQFVAIRQPNSFETWLNYGEIYVGDLWPIQVLVLSKDDTIVLGTEVRIKVFAAVKDPDQDEQLDIFSSRKWEQIFDCKVVSDQDPVSCDFTPTEKNSYRIEAEITDTKGNSHRSSIRVEAFIDDRPQMAPVASTERLDLELLCDSYEVDVGDSIRCKVENHLGSSPILVTVERSGVMDEWLVRLDPRDPFIEFEVLDDYAPHFDLSVLALSARSATSNSDGTLYRIAQTKFTMYNPKLTPLEIRVKSNRKAYAPRDNVNISISAVPPKSLAFPIEYAVAVVDESLLDLSSTDDTYFDPTKKTWRLAETGVRTYGLIASLLEEIDITTSTPPPYFDYTHTPLDGISAQFMMASDPGFENERTTDPNVREVDRFIAYWNPSVVTDNGKLSLEFALPDNLTRWRILVMAVSKDDRFGFATTTFSSSKDTEVRAIVPNIVTEGDKFQIGASILNRAKRRRSINVELQASGLLVPGAQRTINKQLRFKPFERKVVTWDVEAGILPKSSDLMQPISSAEIRVIASASDRRDEDAIDVRIPVRSSRIRVSSIVYGALEGDRTTLPIDIPAPLAKEDGQLDFTLTTNDTLNFDGVFRYAKEYPYTCWEQKLTQALLAMQYIQLEKRGAFHGVEWSDPEGLIARVLESAFDFQAPNGGMAYFIPRNRYVAPYLSAYTAIAFSWLEEAGYETPYEVKRRLLDYLHEFLAQEEDEIQMVDWISDHQEFDHIQATVSAVVVHALSVAQELSERELLEYSRHIKQMDLFGLSHYLMASLRLNPNDAVVSQVFERIMNHRSLVDGAVEFVESVPYGFTQTLHSDTRTLCSVLEALTKYSDSTASGIEIGELKELSNSVRHARDNLPHWRNTQDNVFCTNALLTFFDFVETDVGELSATVDLMSDDTGVSIRLADGWQFSASITRLHAQHPLQTQFFGSSGVLEISRLGSGAAFYNIELSYLTHVNEKINRFSGFEIHREYVVLRDKKWQILKAGDHVNKGEYVTVHLFLNNRFDRNHVVLDDVVPGGLEPINNKLRTEYLPGWDWNEVVDVLPTSKWYEAFDRVSKGWAFRYRELGLQNVRFFAKSIPRGRQHLSWSAQAINAGEFKVLPTHVEEMYRPIMFGKSEPWVLKIEPNKNEMVNSE